MTKIMIAQETLQLEKRKQQAIELGIELSEDITLKELEIQIALKLDEGMKELSEILDEIDQFSLKDIPEI